MKAVFGQPPCSIAPHSAETTSLHALFVFAELSKRELDYRPVLLLPCGAKPSALVGYIRNLL